LAHLHENAHHCPVSRFPYRHRMVALSHALCKTQFKKKSRSKITCFQGTTLKLTSGTIIHENDVLPLAAAPSTRQALFGILEGFNRTDIFPRAYHSLEKSAESFLVNWLEFPTELNAAPDKIELFTSVTLQEEQETFEYLVFKYKKAPPPPGLSDHWMLGVVGPFDAESKPYEIPLRVFSRFNEIGAVSAMDEVRWVHSHIKRK
jgi:hypothetical protein